MKTLLVIGVSVNWANDKKWQTNLLKTWKVIQPTFVVVRKVLKMILWTVYVTGSALGLVGPTQIYCY